MWIDPFGYHNWRVIVLIYKYPLILVECQFVGLPRGAEVLSVQVQYGKACLWAKVDPDAPCRSRRIDLVGTGQRSDVPAAARFLGTVQFDGGSLVLHCFESEV